ncbi:hypothetical protein BASA81_002574 [Batrachochytrium salamandrivorans]|nr:hypothetical protein BASA81_002574 [Batrachochytrium salamandrivorans]
MKWSGLFQRWFPLWSPHETRKRGLRKPSSDSSQSSVGMLSPEVTEAVAKAAHMRLNHNKIIRNIAHMLVGSGEQQAELAEFIAVLCSALRLMLRDCDAGVTCAIRATCLLTRVKDNQELVALSPKLKFLAAFIVANKLQEDFDQAVSNRFWAKTLKGELPQNKLLGLELAFCGAIKFDLAISPQNLDMWRLILNRV